MSKELLITETGSVSLVESKDTTKKGCLGTLRGPAADFASPTRNNRFYSRKLWENVFETPWVKEAIETRTLFGEADHPADRLESRIQEAAIVMTGYSFNDKDQVLEAEFDILDTPSGRILKTLADYGSKIGVSSRGRGNIAKKGDMQVVEESSFIFGGFDAVVLPAVKKARQNFSESLEITSTVIESIINQVNECKTTEQLTCINNILESSNILDESSELVESLKKKFNELALAPNNSDTIVEGLENDLANAYSTISTLESKVLELSETNTISYDNENDYADVISSLVEEQDVLNDKVSSLMETISNKERMINLLNSKLTELNKRSSSRGLNEQKVQALSEDLTKANDQVSILENKLKSALMDAERKTTQLGVANSEISELKFELTETMKSYAQVKCSQFGINPSRTIEALSSFNSLEQLNNFVLEESTFNTRLSRVSINRNKPVLSATVVGSDESKNLSEELETTRAILMSVNNYKKS